MNRRGSRYWSIPVMLSVVVCLWCSWSTAAAGLTQTWSPTLTPTPTPEGTITATFTPTPPRTPTSCRGDLPVVEPVTSPTGLLQQVIRFCGRIVGASSMTVSSEAGSAPQPVLSSGCSLPCPNPGNASCNQTTVTLLANQANHIVVCQTNGSCGGGCVSVDGNGHPLAIVQRLPTPTFSGCDICDGRSCNAGGNGGNCLVQADGGCACVLEVTPSATFTPSPTPTPIPTANECSPAAPDSCPVGKTCNCCCGTYVCMPPYLPCCALACSGQTPLPTPTPVCGNGIVEAGEDCDDGGTCIGGSNAGTHCTAESDCQGNGVCLGGTKDRTACADDTTCPGGLCRHCVPRGGDGCAANCTLEQDVLIDLVPGSVQGLGIKAGTSGEVVHGDIITIPLPLTGSKTLTIGEERAGQIPVVIKTNSMQLPRIPVSSFGCACVRGVTAKTCGGTFVDIDGVTPSTDCTDGYTAGASVCPVDKPCAFLHGPGNAASGAVGCDVYTPIDVTWTQDGGGRSGARGKPIVTLSGTDAPGSALLLSSGATSIPSAPCSGFDVRYGPDHELCTDDDSQSFRGTAITFLATTGTATGNVMNANGMNGDNLGSPFSVSGAPFSCADLAVGNAVGAGFAYAFTQLDQPTLGDIIVTGAQFVADSSLAATPTPTPPASECVGDCSGDNAVDIAELITMVNIALGNAPASACPTAICDVLFVHIDCIIRAVNNALDDCGISGIGGPCGGNVEPRVCAPGLMCQYEGVPDVPGTCVIGATPIPTPTPTNESGVPCSDCSMSCSCAITCPPPVPIGSWFLTVCPDGGCICEFLPI